jgi:hypothetical protein
MNEPLTGHADSLRNNVGDSILWNCFIWARSADPNAELVIYNLFFIDFDSRYENPKKYYRKRE